MNFRKKIQNLSFMSFSEIQMIKDLCRKPTSPCRNNSISIKVVLLKIPKPNSVGVK